MAERQIDDLDLIILAAGRTKRRLIAFADGPLIESEDYRAVVQDIGAFGVFLRELGRLRDERKAGRLTERMQRDAILQALTDAGCFVTDA